MLLNKLLSQQDMSVYQLAKISNLPYTTVNDICTGKTQLKKCTAETVYRIAQAFNISMEELLAPSLIQRNSFENFKSSICQQLKELGDTGFIINTLESQAIRTYYEQKWYPESLYLLAMLDYISRINNVPLCSDYDDLRQYSLEEPLYPAGILSMSAALKNNFIKKQAFQQAIPEFIRFNIVENEVRNVV